MSPTAAMSTRRAICGDAGYRNNAGEPCGAAPIRGLAACRRHVGVPLREAKARGDVRRAVLAWDLDQPLVDPGETLLRLLTVTYGRAQWLASLLQRAYDAAERLRDATARAVTDAGEDAARDLDEVLARGGVSVLIGKTWAADKEAGIYATGEAIRGLAALEQSERKLAADLATRAVAAGIAERQVRLAEFRVDTFVRILAGAAVRAGLDLDSDVVNRAIEAELASLPADMIMST